MSPKLLTVQYPYYKVKITKTLGIYSPRIDATTLRKKESSGMCNKRFKKVVTSGEEREPPGYMQLIKFQVSVLGGECMGVYCIIKIPS